MRPKTKTVNFMLLDGGVGDHIAALVAINYVYKRYTWITPIVWVPDYLKELSLHLLPKDSQVLSFSEMRGRYDHTKPTKTTKWDGNTSPMKIHLVDYAFLRLCDEMPAVQHKNYLQIRPEEIDVEDFGILVNYVVITTGFTAGVREFPALEVNNLVRYFNTRGILPVFLGQTTTTTGVAHKIKGTFRTEIDLTAGMNLIDKTSLLEAAKIMHHARAVIGVDNGLLHLAGCTDTNIVAGYTTVRPEIRLPYRNDSMVYKTWDVFEPDACPNKACQQDTNFIYGHDYRDCLNGTKEKTYLICTKQMTSERFIEGFEKLEEIDNDR